MGRTQAFATRTPPVVASPMALGMRAGARDTGRRRPYHQRRTRQTDPITLRGLYPSAPGLTRPLVLKRTGTPTTSVLCGAAVQTERLWEINFDPLIGGLGGRCPPRLPSGHLRPRNPGLERGPGFFVGGRHLEPSCNACGAREVNERSHDDPAPGPVHRQQCRRCSARVPLEWARGDARVATRRRRRGRRRREDLRVTFARLHAGALGYRAEATWTSTT